LRFRTGSIAAACFSASAILLAAPAAAREPAEAAPEKNVFHGDYAVVGAGALLGPSYEGSDNIELGPAAGAGGEIGGIGFTLRGASLSLDLVPDRRGADVRIRFGPQIRLRTNRSGDVGDPVVAKLGKLDKVVEAGFRAGVGFRNLLSRSDRLSAGVSVRWDISGKGSGMTVTPSATYLLPVSRGHAFGLMASAQLGDGKHADYHYGITPEGAAASGLPAYDAEGGLHEIGIGIGTARDLNGNFLDGGFAIGAGLMYSRLTGSAAQTPITSVRGSRNQWFAGTAVSYTF
jgi:outer membrane scaffolding protein for murein synthesis (MipA/OmpV family)